MHIFMTIGITHNVDDKVGKKKVVFFPTKWSYAKVKGDKWRTDAVYQWKRRMQTPYKIKSFAFSIYSRSPLNH